MRFPIVLLFVPLAPIIARLAGGFACAPKTSLPMLHLYGVQGDVVRSEGRPAEDGFMHETAAKTLSTWANSLICSADANPGQI